MQHVPNEFYFRIHHVRPRFKGDIENVLIYIAEEIAAIGRLPEDEFVSKINTAIEVKVRKYLFHEGFRYRKNGKKLPRKLDIVLPKYRTVIFIHGCFWHRHKGCKDTTTPKTRTNFWEAKFSRNVENDRKHSQALMDMGYKVIVLWECEINKQFDQTMERVVAELRAAITP